MPQFFPQVFITGVVLFLLMGAGYGITQAARAIPWDCADWQAFVHEDRTIVILESLAENRGKTLYCGVDQSDTFAKAETWEAGKDRNERDDTIYSGESGIFRGFIAAQEGYLTDGESGVTGVSIDRIFEFPREKKKRRRYKKVTRRMEVAHDNSRRVRTPFSSQLGAPPVNNDPQAHTVAQNAYTASPPAGFSPAQAADSWQALAETAAATYCADAGYSRAVGVDTGSDTWEYSANQNTFPNSIQYYARKSRTWTATCEKDVRRRR